MKKPTLSSTKLDPVYDALSTLSLEELRKVVLRATTLMKALGGNPSEESDQAVQSDDWMLDGIYSALRNEGRGFQLISLKKLAHTPAYRSYLTYAPQFRTTIEARFQPALAPPEKKLLGLILGEVFLAYVSDRAGTELVSLSQLLYRTEQYMVAIDWAFPGYLEGGLMPVLLKSRQAEVMALA